MNTQWMKTRQTKYGAYITVYLLVIIAVLGAANWLASRHNKSVDTTSNKRYSLSDQTEKVVKGLKQDVTILYFDRSNNFSGSGGARDLLDRYKNLSTKLNVEFIDPEKKPLIAKAEGVRSIPSTIIKVGARKEEAKSLTEEEITSALIRSLKGGERNACFVMGAGEHSLDDTGSDGYSLMKDVLTRNNYKTRTMSLTGAKQEGETPANVKIGQAAGGKPEVPKDCTILVVGAPKYDYPEPAAQAIKAYVEGGGHALFMVAPPLQMGQDDSSDNPELAKLLAGWGVTANKNLILDLSGRGAPMFGPEVALASNYESHPIVNPMKDVATLFKLSRSLEVKSADKTSVEKLISTSEDSVAITDLTKPDVRIDPKKAKKGPFVLAAAGTYNGTAKGRFVVTGSGSWAANSYLRFKPNRDLFLNMMNWLSSDEDLISIRPKSPDDQAVNIQKLGQKMPLIFWSSIVFLPLIVIASGVAVWWRRR
jgi:ABC-type uncharacterized transport system involved in gliding motility auxiliary subunit